MITRRALLQSTALTLAATLSGSFGGFARAASKSPLIERVAAVCNRLSSHGWRQLLLEASNGELDIASADLRAELGKPLGRINRDVPGFAEFATAGARGIEPGNPAASLLYHALASPDVVEDGAGQMLAAFPTPAEIEAVEDYVYGASPPSLSELRQRAGDRPLGLVVFALDYRRAGDSVHGRHADLCFARTGVARMGTVGPLYDARSRSFDPLDAADPFAFRTVPQRFAAFIAMLAEGNRHSHGPRDFVPEDEENVFWVPLHKLFDGAECLAGLDLNLDLQSHLRNEKLKRFHRYLAIEGYQSDWTGADLEQFPFVIQDDRIGSLSWRAEFGHGVLEPRPSSFAERARYRGEWLGFTVPSDFISEPGVLYFSSGQILPGEVETEPTYFTGVAPNTDRPAPEYINVRHRLLEDGTLENLGRRPDMMEVLLEGGYRAQHFIDFAGDGWIEAACPQIAGEIDRRVPAYCLVSPPDFFPLVSQRDLMEWWRNEVPKPIRRALWAVPPLALSQRRIAANITLPAGFSIYDTGVTAIVSHPSAADAVQPLSPPTGRYSGLPDHSPGLFDPGWDASQSIHFGDPDMPLQQFLQSYGLGTPFVEDIKLCAALGSYWPAVAPDSTRSFTPHKRGPGFLYPWPTIVPLTDEEIGSAPLADGSYLPWDGVRGPRLAEMEGRRVAIYPDIMRVDYLVTLDRITAALLARVDLPETKARVLAMSAVYWSLGIRDPEMLAGYGDDPDDAGVIQILKAKADWAVLSFRKVGDDDPELSAAEQATGGALSGEPRYRFHLYRPGAESPHPSDLDLVVLGMDEEAVAFVGEGQVLLRRGDGAWLRDNSMPT
jgi:hypothetical protein